MGKDKLQVFTVGQINSLIKGVLENHLPGRLIVAGEITDWKDYRSGHRYFILKDQDSQIPCVMWKSSFARVKFEPENGLAVMATGYIDVYPPHGKYQLYVEKLEPAGTGALQLAFEQMVRKLEAEGLFKDEHKKPLPSYPNHIAIVTSASGAAVRDIHDSVHSRWPAQLTLFPVPVQGPGAAEKIAQTIRNINRRNKKLKLDLIIVGRGGGSLEDLWAFNEEVLARAIFDSKIPIISAVGHEVDTTIADLVADARASTPTKAGVVAVPDISEIRNTLAHLKSRLNTFITARFDSSRQQLALISACAPFTKPLILISDQAQTLDDLYDRLNNNLRRNLENNHRLLASHLENIRKIEPHRLLANCKTRLTTLQHTLSAFTRRTLHAKTILLTAQQNRLAALDPKSVLKRGYTITTTKTGKLIRSPKDVNIGDPVITALADENFIESQVTKK